MNLLFAHDPTEGPYGLIFVLIVAALVGLLVLGGIIVGLWKLIRFLTRGKNDE